MILLPLLCSLTHNRPFLVTSSFLYNATFTLASPIIQSILTNMDMLAQYVPIVHVVIAVFTVIELGLMAYGKRSPHFSREASMLKTTALPQS